MCVTVWVGKGKEERKQSSEVHSAEDRVYM